MSKSLVVECVHCEAHVSAEIRGEYVELVEGPDEPARNLLLECPKYHGPILAYQWSDWDGDWDRPTVLFPKSGKELGDDVPNIISVSYTEAQKCLKAKAYTASTIMCRRTLEAVCSEFGHSKGTLEKKLAKLKEQGVIDGTLFEWASLLRFAGNSAAHDVAVKMKPRDASDVLDFTHALLEYIFGYRRKFDEYQERQAKKIKPKPQKVSDGAGPETHPVPPEEEKVPTK